MEDKEVEAVLFDDSSLSDLFSDNNSSDEYVPPTSEEDESFSTSFKRKKTTKKPACKRRLNMIVQDSLHIPCPDVGQDAYERGLQRPNEGGNNSEEIPDEDHPVNQNGYEQNDLHDVNVVTTTPKKNVRKKIPNPSKWKVNVRRQAHQSGKEYINKRGKKVQSKMVKNLKNCAVSCKYKCSSKISDEERSDIHLSFYSLQTSTEKRHFILNTTDRFLTARPKRIAVPVQEQIASDESDVSSVTNQPLKAPRRKYSFKYFFNIKSEKIQVCKQFYLGTLDISQKPIYTAHATKNVNTNTPAPDKRGKGVSSRRKPEGNVDFCREHIKSFPSVESHYCRSHTNRTYLGSHLTISKMYDLYLESCKVNDVPPVKKSMYYRIFGTEFNLGFHVPKSDRCDVCEAYKVAKKVETLTEEQENDFQHHQLLKTHMRESRKREKDQKAPPVLLFDLQNVIMTPHADISSLFYLRKLNIYNLTAYFTVTKKVYCVLWPETLSGRAGNDLASALKKILDAVIEENELTEITLWSDSCVPQNRNSIMSNAILDFIRSNPHVQNVTVKYSLPGHSCVQEVDNIHSAIEKAMRATDFYSPIGLVRILKSVSTSNPYKVIQMKESDFKDYASTAKLLNYKTIPYTKISVLVFTPQLSVVQFKSSHDPYEPMNAANIRHEETPLRRKQKSKPTTSDSMVSVLEMRPKVQKKIPEICDLKKKDIKRAFPFMPLQDREYYKVVLKLE